MPGNTISGREHDHCCFGGLAASTAAIPLIRSRFAAATRAADGTPAAVVQIVIAFQKLLVARPRGLVAANFEKS
jgi:hypothetical protein